MSSETPIKSAHAELLNRLSEMQIAAYYRLAKPVLMQAEAVIVGLERERNAARAEAEALRAQLQEAQRDAERLDFLDSNLGFGMGWGVGRAPIGNISVRSVIQLHGTPTAIRAAIDAAMKEEGRE